jgi:peptide deformylase
MIRDIVHYDPWRDGEKHILKQNTEDVLDAASVKYVVDDLLDTLASLVKKYGSDRAIGLAAPQINYPVRIAAVTWDGEYRVLINPKVIKTSDSKRLFRIGCLSFFDYRALIKYSEEITVAYTDEKNEEHTLVVGGDRALVVQHEIDHLSGMLAFDRLEHGREDLFTPRELLYTTSHVPLKNYGWVQMLRRKLGFPKKIQSATEYYSFLFKDSVNFEKYVDESIKKRKELFALVKATTPVGGKILEAGCGTSALSVALSKDGYKVVCTDLDEDMLGLAKRFNENLGGLVEYRKENILDIKAEDDTFDTVYSHGVLEHFSEDSVVEAVNEGLRVGKRYLISIPTVFDVSNNLLGDENLWTKGKWEKLIGKSNGKIVRVIGSFPFHPRLERLNNRFGQKLTFLAPVLIFVVEQKG